jgi:hypothetical protein
MKALTLWRPWPWAIFHLKQNPKRIENRPWKPWESIIGQTIVLHAGKHFDSEAAEDFCSRYAIHPDGAAPHGWKDEGLIGLARVVGCRSTEGDVMDWMPDQVIWWAGPHAWLLSDVRAFREPIPCKGTQGLWDLPPWAEERVRKEWRP